REDRCARQGERNRDDEEEEPGREGSVRADVKLAEEADEERLADGEPVDRERDEHDEEEQRPHHVVDAGGEGDPDRLRRPPDRPLASRKPIAARPTVAAPPSARSSSTDPATGPPRPGCRRVVSKMRIASPPIDVGSTCPAVYAVK